MSDGTEVCTFCHSPIDPNNDLAWDLGDNGDWCGSLTCPLGIDVVKRKVTVSEISQRRKELRQKRPFSDPAIAVLDSILTDLFPKDLRV